jgi:hypothetical protein
MPIFPNVNIFSTKPRSVKFRSSKKSHYKIKGIKRISRCNGLKTSKCSTHPNCKIMKKTATRKQYCRPKKNKKPRKMKVAVKNKTSVFYKSLS